MAIRITLLRRLAWRRSTVAVLALLLGVIARPAPAAAQPPHTRLAIEINETLPARRPHAPGGPATTPDGYTTLRLSVVRESTGELWASIDCRLRCELVAVPPGRYRLIAESLDGVDRYVITGIPVEARRAVAIQIGWRLGRHEVPASAHLTPRDAPQRPGTRVSIWSPEQGPWLVIDACGMPDPARLSTVRFWEERSPGTFKGSEFWGEDREWWGTLTGTVRDQTGTPATGVSVTLEYIDRTDVADTVFHTTLWAHAGCYGLHGLWPGRYRVLVDDPSFVALQEVDVNPDGLVTPARRDVTLAAAPEREPAGLLPVRPTYSGRLGRFASLDDLLRLVRNREPAVLQAIGAGTLAAADVEVVEGVVVVAPSSDDGSRASRLADARVILEHEVSGMRHEVSTDADGSYRLPVPEGRYRMRVEYSDLEPASARVLVLPEGFAVLEPDGFRAARRSGVYAPRVTLRSGLMARLNVGLVLHFKENTDSASSAVTVEGTRLPEDIAPPLGGIVSRSAFDVVPELSASPLWPQMPLSSGRTVESFHHAYPGITSAPQTGNLARFTAAGQRRYANRLTIDGISADLGVDVGARGPGIGEPGSGALPATATSGGTQTLVPLAAVEDIQVRTTNATPEHARTPGAQIAIVTRAGTNRFSGSAFADVRPEPLSATDFFDNARGRRRARDFSDSGLSFGGPLPVPRSNYWFAYERQDIDRSLERTFPVPSLAVRETAPAALRPLLDAYPRPNGPELSGERAETYGGGLADLTMEIPATSALSVLSARVDANGQGRHRVFVRASHGRSTGDALTMDGQSPFVSFDNIESTRTTSLTAGVTSIGSSAVHDFKMSVIAHRGSLTAGIASYGGALPPPAGVLAPPGATNEDTWARLWMFQSESGSVMDGRFASSSQRQLQLVDTWTFLRGRHEWKIGVDYRRVAARTDAAPTRYTYRFDDVPGFIAGAVWPVAVDHYAPAGALLQTWSAFAQDDMRVSSRLSLHFGARYSVKPAPTSLTDMHPLLMEFPVLPDIQPRPTGASLWKTSWTDFAPRVAVTYQMRTAAGSETTMRAGWSRVFDELTSPGAVAFGRGFPYQWRREVRPSMFPVPAAELAVSAPSSFAESINAGAFSFSPDLVSPRTDLWHVGFDQAFGNHQRLALTYVGAAGRRLPYSQTYYTDRFQRHAVHAYSAEASSDYNALFAQYTRRLWGGLQALIVYTWSHAIDTDSGESRDPNLPTSISPISANRASADFDRRHVLYITASYQLPTLTQLPQGIRALLSGWHVGIVARGQSGTPITIQARRDFGRYGSYVARPDIVPGAPVLIDDPASPTGQRINAAAFSNPEEPRQGNLGRNTMRASSLGQVDLSLVRSIRLGGSVTARFRVDVFNALNKPNFGPPWNDTFLEPFGLVYQSYAHALGAGTLGLGGLPPMQQAGDARAIQVGVAMSW